ncbi:MAG: hypothetical protein QM759_16740 [Terricaulis sp.]
MSSKGFGPGAVISGVIAVAAILCPAALAQQATEGPPAPSAVNFNDPGINLSFHNTDGSRFSSTNPTETGGPGNRDQVEMQVSASGAHAGVPVDVAFAHRGSLNSDETGRDRRGSEFRVGHNLVQQRDPNKAEHPSVYAFVASDNEALTWRPGGHDNGASLAMQDQVEVGDRSAGVTYENHGVQTSLAYVERDIHTRVGGRNYSTDENFAGVTVTLRH